MLSRAHVLAHGVNCEGRMGAGIAVEFKRRFPSMFTRYREMCNDGRLTPGGVYLEKNTSPWVLNLATQSKVGRAELAYVHSCIKWIADHFEQEGITTMAMPRIAAGLGKLPWEPVEQIIQELLQPLPLPVFLYDQYVKGVEADEST